MQDLLIAKDLFFFVMGKQNPKKMSGDEWKILHLKATVKIRQWVNVTIFPHISKDVKADHLRKKLEAMYEKNTFRNKATAIKRLVNLKYIHGKSMT